MEGVRGGEGGGRERGGERGRGGEREREEGREGGVDMIWRHVVSCIATKGYHTYMRNHTQVTCTRLD